MGASRIAGRYELQDQLGEGGMGVVWRALDVKTGSAVAIKLMKDISDPVAVELFTKEWKALAEISHPNIVEVRDVDVVEENRQKKPFFVMPLLRGATLAELIANASARLTLERIVEITTHVCRGLQAAHQRGLVHRDLKPSNIFVMDDDTAKIIDFGVVHLAGSKSVTGQKGTFQYMSPEQAQLKPITPASDLFSMGVILYEALTLRKPFGRRTADETMEAVIKFIPPPVSEINPSINQPVSKVVHKCLAKQPIHRFASARELAETLQKAARNETWWDPAKIEPRIERARTAFKNGDDGFASEILAELEAEGNLDARITDLRTRIDLAVKQKKVRSLLESARARMEQEEIPLALDKIREILELDPQNGDALGMRTAMEKQRNETQIAKWLELAETHLSNRDFAAARNAAQEVLAIRRADPRALDLLEKVESTEADAKRIRDQKEQLYSSALKAYQNGEIESALSKLERLFSVVRANPNAAIPERDAVYQSFYNEVRSESDSIHSALEDAQRQFSEKNFAGAMLVCRELLEKYPNDGTFQALKIRIEDAERQEQSSYRAEVSNRLEAEPDLDKRLNIVRQASERYPHDTQFGQQLKLVRERRDFVNSIVAKARQYEERGQYAEAISQWDILRNIHPQYPGIAFELEQCKKKRDRQAREEEHSRLIEEIEGLMESRVYAKARECAEAALLEFPGDAEFSGMRTLAEQGLERTKESRRLFDAGQRASAEGDLGRATELLRSSLNLDPRGPGLRDALVNLLTERGRSLAEENWQQAEPLLQEASELDANHPAVRALRSTVNEAKRQTVVGQCLAECRSLVSSGKAQEAAELVRKARAEYPKDARLEQYEAGLQKEVNEARRREERGRDRAVLGENRRFAEINSDRAKLRAVWEQSIAISKKYPDDAEIAQSVAEVEASVKRAANVEDLSQLLSMETALTGTDGGAAVVSKPGGQAAQRTGPKKGPKLVDKGAEKTKLFESPEREIIPSRFQILLRDARAFAQRGWTATKHTGTKVVALGRPSGKWSSKRLGTAAGVLMVAATLAYFAFRTPVKVSPPHPSLAKLIDITINPADSAITSDGEAITDRKARVGATIEVSYPGYKPKKFQVQPDFDGKIVLEPEPVRLSIHTSEAVGDVILDGNKIDELEEGSIDEVEIPADGNVHKLSLGRRGRTLLTVEIQTPAASQPKVNSVDANDLLVITSLGNQATVYGGKQLQNVQVGAQGAPVSPAGTALTLNEQDPQVRYRVGNDEGSISIGISKWPTLALQTLNAQGQVVVPETNVKDSTLTVNGLPIPHRKNGWTVSRSPGQYTFQFAAPGYKPEEVVVTMQRGQVTKLHPVELKPVAVTPVTASLLITNATPGAEVELDGRRMGEVDHNGRFALPNALTAGKHKVILSKAGFDGRTFDLDVRPPSEATISEAELIPTTTTVAFETDPRNATVKYRRTSDESFKECRGGEKVGVPPGAYEIVATAPWYKEVRTQETISGSIITIPLKLPPDPVYGFQDSNEITMEGQWFRAKGQGKVVWLKPGLLHVSLLFAKQGKTLLWDKKVEWLVDLESQKAQVRYVLGGDKLTRKATFGNQSVEPKEAKVDAQVGSHKELISVHVNVDGDRVRITNDATAMLDEITAPRDLSSGRIGIKTDSDFLVRSENQ